MAKVDRPVVIGGGAAGIAACLTLEAAGMSPILLEGGDRLGGRLRTERMSDGTPVDIGFQVLLTAYPELQRWTDMAALEPVRFVPGARIHRAGQWRTLADPRRRPALIPATLFSGIGTWSDGLRILRMVVRLRRGPAEAVQTQSVAGTTLEGLRDAGFSEGFIRDFLRPFFSGIFLNRDLAPPLAQFQYTLRMFASGDVVRPRGGVEALVHQWQGRMDRTEVRLNQRVSALAGCRIELEHGEAIEADQIICTVPELLSSAAPVSWNGALNAVFEVEDGPFGLPIIGLLPEAHTVTNFHYMADVQGQEGEGKLNATAVLSDGASVESGLEAMADDLQAAGVRVGKCLWHAAIPRALPRLNHVAPALLNPEVQPGLWRAGDATAAPSLDAALRSGRVAAEALVNATERT